MRGKLHGSKIPYIDQSSTSEDFSKKKSVGTSNAKVENCLDLMDPASVYNKDHLLKFGKFGFERRSSLVSYSSYSKRLFFC